MVLEHLCNVLLCIYNHIRNYKKKLNDFLIPTTIIKMIVKNNHNQSNNLNYNNDNRYII